MPTRAVTSISRTSLSNLESVGPIKLANFFASSLLTVAVLMNTPLNYTYIIAKYKLLVNQANFG